MSSVWTRLLAVAVVAGLTLSACGESDEPETDTDEVASRAADVPPQSAEEFCDRIAGTRHPDSPYRAWIRDYCLPIMTASPGTDLAWVEQNMVASCLIDSDAASLGGCIDETVVQRYADELPDCSDIWFGELLPEGYKGCVLPDGTLEPARSGECPILGTEYFVFFTARNRTFVAYTNDWVIHDADAEGNGTLCFRT